MNLLAFNNLYSSKQAQKFHTDDSSLPTTCHKYGILVLVSQRRYFVGKPAVMASRDVVCFLLIQ